MPHLTKGRFSMGYYGGYDYYGSYGGYYGFG